MNLIQNINMRLGVGESTQYLTTFENIELLCNKPPHNNWLIGLINFVKLSTSIFWVDKKGIRIFTEKVLLRLQGFPDNFVIPVSDNQAYKQFGNSQ